MMMDHMEMAEKLVKKANISLSEAKEVLERHNWDMLEAMIELERAGKTYDSAAAAHSGSGEKSYETVHATASENASARSGAWQGWQQLRALVRMLIDKSMQNHFIVEKTGRVILDIPVLVLVLALICFCPLTIFFLIAGLFCGCGYSFQGKELGTESINNGMKKASDVAQDIAEQVRSSMQDK